MSKIVQWKRGNANVSSTYTGFDGEITVNTDSYNLHVHDGTTQGGHIIGNTTGNLSITDQTIAGTISNANVILQPIGNGALRSNAQFASFGLDARLFVQTLENSNVALITTTSRAGGNKSLYLGGNLGVPAISVNPVYPYNVGIHRIFSDGYNFAVNGSSYSTEFYAEANFPTGYQFNTPDGDTGISHSYQNDSNGNVSLIRIRHAGETTAKFYDNLTTSITGNLTVSQDGATYGTFPNAFVQVYSNVDSYSQFVMQNLSADPLASADIVITGDDGDDVSHYLDIGMASSTYNYPGFGIIKPDDSYILAVGDDTAGPGSTENANLILGSTNGNVKVFVGAPEDANLIASFSTTGFVPGANVTYSLGTASRQWKDLWLSNSTLYLGGTPITVANGTLQVNGSPISSTGNYANSNVAAFLAAFGSNSINTTGNINANINASYVRANGLYGTTTNDTAFLSNASGLIRVLVQDNGINIQTYDHPNLNYHTWTFNSVGDLYLPSNNGGIYRANGQPYGSTDNYSNANVAAYLPVYSGNVSANNFIGNIQGNIQGLIGSITNLDSGNFTVENVSARIAENGVNIGAGGYNNLVVLPTEVLIQNVPLTVAGNIFSNVAGGLYITANTLANGTAHTWNFGTDGRLTFPGTPRIDTDANNFEIQAAEIVSVEANAVVNIYTDTSGTTYQWQFDDSGSLILPGSTAFLYATANAVYLNSDSTTYNSIDIVADGDTTLRNQRAVKIVADSDGSGYNWSFNANGELAAPGNITTTGNISVGNILAQNIRTIEGAVHLGQGAGLTDQGSYSIAVGRFAATTNQGNLAVAVGYIAGQTNQGDQATAIGYYTATTDQSANAVAIGTYAGRYTQGVAAVAIGALAGNSAQGSQSIAIGSVAGQSNQGTDAVAIGTSAGGFNQREGAVAIGQSAGVIDQGVFAVAIGSGAGYQYQANNSIAITATGTQLSPEQSGFYVDPVREDVGNIGTVAFYNINTKEFTYSNTISINGNLTAGNVITEAIVLGSGGISIGLSASPAPRLSGFAAISTIKNVNTDEGNITAGGNLIANINAHIAGNVYSGNVSATGNINASYFVGNGALLTGISAGTGNYGNSNVSAFLASFGTNTIVTSGNVTVGNIITGNGINGYIYLGNANSRLTQIGSNAYATFEQSIVLSPDTNKSALAGIVIGGNGYLLGPNGARNLTLNYNSDSGHVGLQANVTVGSAGQGGILNVAGTTVTGANVLVGGITNSTAFPNTVAKFSSNIDGYSQMLLQNKSNGTDATTDIVATANNGTDSIFFVDMGIAGNTYDNASPNNSLGTLLYANDSYLYAQGNTSATVGGNLVIGASTAGKVVKIFANGINSSSTVATFSNLGIDMTGNVTTTGNVTVTANVVAGNIVTTGSGGNISGVNVLYANSIVLSSNAAISMPARPAMRVYGNTSANIGVGTTLTGSYFIVDYNQASALNAGTGIFTAPAAGLYSVTLVARVGSNNGLNQIAVLKNDSSSGANVICFWETDTNAGTAVHFGTSGTANLSVGDTLRAKVLAGNIQFDSNDSWTITYIG